MTTSPPSIDLGSPRRLRRHRFGPEIREELRRLSQDRDDYHGPLALAQDIAVIAVAIWMSWLSPFFYPLTLLLIGSRHRALGTLQHEASHGTLCRNFALNRAIGMLAGWSIFQTLHAYRASHVGGHHSHLGNEDRDPNLRAFVRQGLFETDPRRMFRDHFIPLLLGLKSWANFKNLVRERLWPRDWAGLPKSARFEYLGFVGFWIAILVGCVWADLVLELVLFWVIPYFTAFQAVNWIIELAEHFPLVRLYDTELYMTRNRQGPWIERVLVEVHGENWHLVHHLAPGIPHWRLAQAHQTMMQDPVYAKANAWAGGLVLRGPSDQPSMASMVADQLIETQAAPLPRTA